MRRITYLPLVVPAFLSMGQVVNQVVPEPEPAAEFVQRSHQGTGSAIVVDGAPVETKADPPCWPVLGDDDEGHRFIACGNGTVHDTVTALIWLENANCFVCEVPGGCQAEDGERNWFDASVFAADLAAPQCGLMDHSQPGDWRLPTTEEVEDVFESSCSAPKIVGKAGGCHSDASG
ncbi:MAG: DUF1566 domain-containing protein, partial [Acidobacteriota bacterium]|nr:DUF1566 domain-containing protein [Acidobacteriota bacterium]